MIGSIARRVGAAVAALVFTASAHALSLPPSQIAELCSNAEDQAHCGRMIEEAQLKRLPGLAVRDGDDLRITLFPSGVVSFRDSVQISGAKSYTLWDYLDRINAVVLFTTDGDQSGFVLLQRANGKQYRMPADPVLSPDRQRLVTVDICANICEGEIVVWRVTRDDITKELVWKPKPAWSDAAATWIDGDTLRLEYTTASGSPARETRRLDDAVWARVAKKGSGSISPP